MPTGQVDEAMTEAGFEARHVCHWPRLRIGLALAFVGAVLAAATMQVVESSRWFGLPPPAVGDSREFVPDLLRNGNSARLERLPFIDPSRLLQIAGKCMVNTPRVSDCRPELLRALKANRRSTQAALWMAQIASFEGNEEAARAWYRYGYEWDRSFAVLWGWANSGLSGIALDHEEDWVTPGRQPGGAELPRGEQLDRQLLLMAPPNFEAHFPLLLGKGKGADSLFARLSMAGQPKQTAALLRFLLRDNHPDSARLVQQMLQGDNRRRGLHSMPCAEMARHVVTNILRASATDSLVEQGRAEDVWRAAVEGNTVVCDATESRLLPDKRLHRDQDPVWNFNPGLRLPMIPESFDWSLIAHPASQVRPLCAGGGLVVTLEPTLDIAVVVLARRLPLLAHVARPREGRGVELRVRWRQAPPPECTTGWQWELRNRSGEQRFSYVPAWQSGQPSADRTTEARYFLSLPEEERFPQLLLRFAPEPGSECGRQVVALEHIEVFPVDGQSPGTLARQQMTRLHLR